MGGDEQGPICRVDPQAVDVDRAGLGGREQIANHASVVIASTAGNGYKRDRDDGCAQGEESD
jgi:hypothetical protein